MGTTGSDNSIVLTISNDSQEKIISSKNAEMKKKLMALVTEDAMNQIVKKLNNHSDKLACLLRKATLLADVDEDKVILNKGKMHGYCKKLKLSIERKIKIIKDPATGIILSIKTKKVGEIELADVDSQFSVGIIKSKNNEFNKVKVENLLVKPTDSKLCLNQSYNEQPKSLKQEKIQA